MLLKIHIFTGIDIFNPENIGNGCFVSPNCKYLLGEQSAGTLLRGTVYRLHTRTQSTLRAKPGRKNTARSNVGRMASTLKLREKYLQKLCQKNKERERVLYKVNG